MALSLSIRSLWIDPAPWILWLLLLLHPAAVASVSELNFLHCFSPSASCEYHAKLKQINWVQNCARKKIMLKWEWQQFVLPFSSMLRDVCNVDAWILCVCVFPFWLDDDDHDYYWRVHCKHTVSECMQYYHCFSFQSHICLFSSCWWNHSPTERRIILEYIHLLIEFSLFVWKS